MSTFDLLEERIRSRSARVCVLGQGYVGLSVACGAAQSGMTVVGIDLDAERIAALSNGSNVVPGVHDANFAEAFDTGRLTFDVDPSHIGSADVVLICVPTPLVDHRPELPAVESAASAPGDGAAVKR